MTPEELAQANEAIDRFEDGVVVGEELARGSKRLAGTGRPTLDGLLELPQPYCDPFGSAETGKEVRIESGHG